MKTNYQRILDDEIKKLVEEAKTPTLLIHACCAPCSSYVIKYLSKYFKITIFFYNPNIANQEEYTRRSQEIVNLIENMKNINKVEYIIEDYNNKEFYDTIIGHENDIEGGQRCSKCYELRLRKTAKQASLLNFDYFTTTLSISPFKNCLKINDIGLNLEEEYKVKYLQADFKKKNGFKKSEKLSKKYNLLRQDYCGCIYSEKDTIKRNANKSIEQTENRKNKFLALILMALVITIFTFPAISLGKKIITKNNAVLTQTEVVELNELYVYGKNLNIKGKIKLDNIEIDDVSIFFSGENNFYSDIIYEYKNGIINFTLAEKINEGFSLENFDIGEYNVYLAVHSKNKMKYYNIINKTKYKKTFYFTMSNKNQKIKIEDDKTLNIDVKENKQKAVDIVIDPGHGGSDTGACYNNKCEIDYTLDLSNKLKKDLEDMGYKVSLTRENNDTLETYGTNSRTGIPYEMHAKFLVSIHLNAGPKYNGYEIYTPYNVNYVFANSLKNKFDNLGAVISPNTFNKVSDGIYTRTMSNDDLKHFVKHANENKYYKYPATDETNYYYMIRETGGYMTGAYTDGRFKEDGANPYLLSNVGTESYIIELGYITSLTDMESINTKTDKYISAISESIDNYLN